MKDFWWCKLSSAELSVPLSAHWVQHRLHRQRVIRMLLQATFQGAQNDGCLALLICCFELSIYFKSVKWSRCWKIQMGWKWNFHFRNAFFFWCAFWCILQVIIDCFCCCKNKRGIDGGLTKLSPEKFLNTPYPKEKRKKESMQEETRTAWKWWLCVSVDIFVVSYGLYLKIALW